MEQPLASVLVLPDIGVFWPGQNNPTWTVAGISSLERWFGSVQVILTATPNFTIDQLMADDTGFGSAWTHWVHQRSLQGVNAFLAVDRLDLFSLVSPAMHLGQNSQQVILRILDKNALADWLSNRKRESCAWSNLFFSDFDIAGWDITKMYMSNLTHNLTALPGTAQKVTVVEEIGGQLAPFTVVVPATT